MTRNVSPLIIVLLISCMGSTTAGQAIPAKISGTVIDEGAGGKGVGLYGVTVQVFDAKSTKIGPGVATQLTGSFVYPDGIPPKSVVTVKFSKTGYVDRSYYVTLTSGANVVNGGLFRKTTDQAYWKAWAVKQNLGTGEAFLTTWSGVGFLPADTKAAAARGLKSSSPPHVLMPSGLAEYAAADPAQLNQVQAQLKIAVEKAGIFPRNSARGVPENIIFDIVADELSYEVPAAGNEKLFLDQFKVQWGASADTALQKRLAKPGFSLDATNNRLRGTTTGGLGGTKG